MSPHLLKARSRRIWRKQTAKVATIGQQAGEQFDKNLLARVGRLKLVWRFMLSWTLLFLLIVGCLSAQIVMLKGYYQVQVPVPGGRYSEGMTGSFTTASPLYALSDIDTSVSRLVFASLLTYDTQNHLVGDLADRWSVSTNGMVYTVHLRPNLTWQDGRALTAADVVFTYQTIQDPDAQSPLQSSWQGIRVAAVDNQTITFTLPNPLSSFPYSLTNGIVPEHILGNVSPADLRSVGFNTANPIGAGPFAWGSVGATTIGQGTEAQINLTPFHSYWAGAPKLSSFTITAYPTDTDLINAYRNNEITAIAGLSSLPPSIAQDGSSHIYSAPLTAGVYVFFKTTDPTLNDAHVRQALVVAASRPAVIASVGYDTIPVDEPLLKDQLGYDRTYMQLTNNLAQASNILTSDGWQPGAGGIRMRNGQPLAITLAALDNTEYAKVANLLVSEWRSVGIDASVTLEQPDDFQAALSTHSYQAVLDGISIGVDPDVFVYWDSSQADIRSVDRLNFSEYKSTIADEALEAGRTRLDSLLRIVKYRSFLQAWQKDNPALGLYQPRLLYVSHIPVYGFTTGQVNSDADRFNNVQNWMIHVGWVDQK